MEKRNKIKKCSSGANVDIRNVGYAAQQNANASNLAYGSHKWVNLLYLVDQSWYKCFSDPEEVDQIDKHAQYWQIYFTVGNN